MNEIVTTGPGFTSNTAFAISDCLVSRHARALTVTAVGELSKVIMRDVMLEDAQDGSAVSNDTTIGSLAIKTTSTNPVNTPPLGDKLGLSRGQRDTSQEWSPLEGLHLPDGHRTHVSTDAELVVDEVTVSFPVLTLASMKPKPASQTQRECEGVEAAGAATEPASHEQDWLPGIEFDREGHARHCSDPAEDLYLPASQFAQGPPSLPVAPALHLQCNTAVLPAGEMEYCGQSKQLPTDSDPVAAEYLPAGQSVHSWLPFTPLYLPAVH